MKFNCPHCNHEYNTTKAHPGKKAKCKECGQTFIIPKEPIEITPSPQLPFEKIEPKKEKKKAGRLFINLWNRSPAAFRTAFLSTLGVVCALWFAWTIMGIGNKVTKSNRNTPITAGTNRPVKINGKTEYLAATTILIEYHTKFSTIISIREKAAANAAYANTELAMYGFLETINSLHPQLSDLYQNARKLKIPNNENVINTHKTLLNAIEAEYNFQIAAIQYLRNLNDLQANAKFNETLEISKKASANSLISVVTLMIYIDDGFLEAYAKITGE